MAESLDVRKFSSAECDEFLQGKHYHAYIRLDVAGLYMLWDQDTHRYQCDHFDRGLFDRNTAAIIARSPLLRSHREYALRQKYPKLLAALEMIVKPLEKRSIMSNPI